MVARAAKLKGPARCRKMIAIRGALLLGEFHQDCSIASVGKVYEQSL